MGGLREAVGTWEHGESVEEGVDLREMGCKPIYVEGLEIKVNE